MKKTLFTSVAVAALVFGIGTTQACAKSPNSSKQNQYGHPAENFSERNFDQHNQNMMPKMKFQHGGIENAVLLGTVTAINEASSMLTVKDADGKETQVHVNPFTRLHPMPKTPVPDEKSEKEKKRPEFNELKLSDLKNGDWIAVTKMKTETKTIEAARIVVAKD